MDFLAMMSKANPELAAKMKPRASVEDQKEQRDHMIAKRELARAAKPSVRVSSEPAYPLGGYDPKSHRSYSD